MHKIWYLTADYPARGLNARSKQAELLLLCARIDFNP